MASTVSTRIFILSDTHGDALNSSANLEADVVIHCGGLTEESKLEEFTAAVQLLTRIDAPVKLVIGGNHDFALDDAALAANVAARDSSIEEKDAIQTYGKIGDARRILESESAKEAGIVYLTEGTHRMRLKNGALLTVYASPYTPSISSGFGFTYKPREQAEHQWSIGDQVDIAITHGPPCGILDYTSSKVRAGSQGLFAAVAQAKPKIHCFGHIHEAWGAKQVTWREELPDTPTHFTAIDNDESMLIANRSMLRKTRFDSQDEVDRKEAEMAKIRAEGYFNLGAMSLRSQEQTLFLNAAIEGDTDEEQQPPFMVEVELPKMECCTAVAASETRKRKADETVDGAFAERRCRAV